MENFQISKEQEKELVSHFGARANMGIALIVIGLSGLVPTIITAVGYAAINPYFSFTFVFFIIGIMFMNQGKEAAKNVEKGDYEAFKTVCKKVGWEYATVDNNEVLSKNVKKPTKKVGILGSKKGMNAGDEIGIIKVSKGFWAFPIK